MQNTLAGKRILVVEDEYFIASDLKRALVEHGAVVVGPVGDLNDGLAAMRGQPVDAAVLDVNLEGTNSYPIADLLTETSVPYIFLTGYDGWSLPEKYRAMPRIAKPHSMPAVLSAVEQLLMPGVPT
jgi:DNA-binding response OmpR family regulator